MRYLCVCASLNTQGTHVCICRYRIAGYWWSNHLNVCLSVFVSLVPCACVSEIINIRLPTPTPPPFHSLFYLGCQRVKPETTSFFLRFLDRHFSISKVSFFHIGIGKVWFNVCVSQPTHPCPPPPPPAPKQLISPLRSMGAGIDWSCTRGESRACPCTSTLHTWANLTSTDPSFYPLAFTIVCAKNRSLSEGSGSGERRRVCSEHSNCMEKKGVVNQNQEVFARGVLGRLVLVVGMGRRL